MNERPTLSTGDPATLGNYRKLAAVVFGGDGPAVRFLDEKIDADPDGEDGFVLADERQMIYLLMELTHGGNPSATDKEET